MSKSTVTITLDAVVANSVLSAALTTIDEYEKLHEQLKSDGLHMAASEVFRLRSYLIRGQRVLKDALGWQ